MLSQNGTIERFIRTIRERMRAILHQSGLPLAYWNVAAMTAIYQINLTPNAQIGNIIPFEIWYGWLPEFKDLCAFGALVTAFIPEEYRSKLQPTGVNSIFLAYLNNQKGYLLLRLDNFQLVKVAIIRLSNNIFPVKEDKLSVPVKFSSVISGITSKPYIHGPLIDFKTLMMKCFIIWSKTLILIVLKIYY